MLQLLEEDFRPPTFVREIKRKAVLASALEQLFCSNPSSGAQKKKKGREEDRSISQKDQRLKDQLEGSTHGVGE